MGSHSNSSENSTKHQQERQQQQQQQRQQKLEQINQRPSDMMTMTLASFGTNLPQMVLDDGVCGDGIDGHHVGPYVERNKAVKVTQAQACTDSRPAQYRGETLGYDASLIPICVEVVCQQPVHQETPPPARNVARRTSNSAGGGSRGRRSSGPYPRASAVAPPNGGQWDLSNKPPSWQIKHSAEILATHKSDIQKFESDNTRLMCEIRNLQKELNGLTSAFQVHTCLVPFSNPQYQL